MQDIELYRVTDLGRTFFVAFLPKGSGGQLIGRDERGNVIDKVEVPPKDL